MMRLLIFLGATIGSYIGWAIGDFFGGNILVSFLVSSTVAGFGIYLGWKIGTNMD